ncbi:GOLD domain-containing protein [Aphelenchoides besseyi]|nr:GOLD domain-containing protein [Aphelenchoides besseyi]
MLRKYECYFQSVTSEKHKNMEIEYQVIDGGDLNINFIIPLKGLGDYQLCFDNTFSYQTRKVVFFEVFLTDSDGNMDDVDLSQFANNDSNFAKRLEEIGITLIEFHAASNRIKNSLNKIEYYQSTLRSFEHRDKVIMAANLSRVSFYSLLTTAVLLIVAVLQVYTIRTMMFKWYLLVVVLATLTFHARSQVPTTQHPVTEAAEEVILQLVVEAGRIECIYQPITQSKHVAIELDYQKITTKVKGNLNEVERIQTQFRAIEARDRALVEASFERVNFWSVVNLLAVITVLAVQVVTIRSLFIENSKLGRLVRKGRLND